MSKRARQYLGLLSAIVAYYLIHEGAHLLYALLSGAFKRLNFMGLGVQIDVYSENMTQTQLGIFCLLGSVATLVTAYLLIAWIGKITQAPSKLFKACAYYITFAMLVIDPLYLSLLCGMFGGGDMNGIGLLVSPIVARVFYGIVLVINVVVFVRIVFPKYQRAFHGE